MKKFLILAVILLASMCCTACINNLAIQELNQIGKDYLEKGDYDNAISRFKSGLDLDENVFESRYNLGVAYVSKGDYDSAIENLKIAVNLNPNSPDAYYSYAVALEKKGLQFEDVDENDDTAVKNGVAKDTVQDGLLLVKEAIDYYNNYLELAKDSSDEAAVTRHIDDLKRTIYEHCETYGINSDDIIPKSVVVEEE